MSDARWGDPRAYDARDLADELPRVYDTRDRDDQDPRDGLMRDLDLPRGDERELVVDRDRVYELDGEDSRTLAAVGAFRIVPEHDLDLPHDSLQNLHDQRLVDASIEFFLVKIELWQIADSPYAPKFDVICKKNPYPGAIKEAAAILNSQRRN